MVDPFTWIGAAAAKSVFWKIVKYGSPIILLAAMFFWGYSCGKQKERIKVQTKVIKEVITRYEQAEKESAKAEVIREKVKKSREVVPMDDKRDSCLLSGDPTRSKCL